MIREAKQKDIEQITLLCIQTAPFEGTGEPGEVEFYNKLFTESISHDERLILVAESDSVIAGFAYAEIEHSSDDCVEAPYASLELLGVDPRWRGKGIAKALIETVEDWARNKKMKAIQLAVAQENVSALKLYESLGYRTVMRKMQKEL